MKRFDDLSQDWQMKVVDEMADSIIFSTLDGITLPCFENFAVEINQFLNQAGAYPAYCTNDAKLQLRHKIENIPAIKLAMLHEAGRMARKAFYIENGDLVMRLDTRKFAS